MRATLDCQYYDDGSYLVKAFFVVLLLASIVSVLYELSAGLSVMAHNHYESRHSLLDTTKEQPDHQSTSLGLTPKELSTCDVYIAAAYKESVTDGYRLGAGYNALSVQCLGLAALLFLSSIVGLRAVRKGDNLGDRMSNQRIQRANSR